MLCCECYGCTARGSPWANHDMKAKLLLRLSMASLLLQQWSRSQAGPLMQGHTRQGRASGPHRELSLLQALVCQLWRHLIVHGWLLCAPPMLTLQRHL